MKLFHSIKDNYVLQGPRKWLLISVFGKSLHYGLAYVVIVVVGDFGCEGYLLF